MDVTLAPVSAPGFLKLLAHDLRWKILTMLARSDYNGQGFVHLLGQPQNLVSYHLRKLYEQGLIAERRSTADERSIYYSLDLEMVRSLYLTAGEALHPAMVAIDTRATTRVAPTMDGEDTRAVDGEDTRATTMVAPIDGEDLRVLFLCTENSARSQMAEALLRHLSHGRVEAYSAGSHPTRVHPLALQALEASEISTEGLRAKSIDEFLGLSFDYIVTVCDRVREACPTFPGDPERIHWSFADPATVEGTAEERYRVFEQTSLQLTTRLRFLLTLLERIHRR